MIRGQKGVECFLWDIPTDRGGNMKTWIVAFLCVIAAIIAVHAKPTIYKRNEDNVYEPVMVPVSSTVIPLPVYKVGYGLGFVSKDKKIQSSFKPEGGIKLITINKVQEKKI